jgi:hypothetical protein
MPESKLVFLLVCRTLHPPSRNLGDLFGFRGARFQNHGQVHWTGHRETPTHSHAITGSVDLIEENMIH